MRACVVRGAGAVGVEDVADPGDSDDRVIVEVAFGGICGSDVHYALHGRNGDYEVLEPLVLGHEVSGRIVSVGAEVRDSPPVGSAVAVHPATPCPPAEGYEEREHMDTHLSGSYFGSAATVPHSQGAFAELISVRPDQLRVLPAGLTLRRAALAEPLAVALHAIGMLGDLDGRRVLVSGAGPIGALAVLALRRRGAVVIASDMHAGALRIASAVGATSTLLIGADAPLSPGAVDAVIEASGAVTALHEGVRVVRDGGTVVQLGIVPPGELRLPLLQVLTRELTIRGSWRFDLELDEAIAMLEDAPEADAIITHEFSLDELDQAFRVAADPSNSSKVLLRLVP